MPYPDTPDVPPRGAFSAVMLALERPHPMRRTPGQMRSLELPLPPERLPFPSGGSAEPNELSRSRTRRLTLKAVAIYAQPQLGLELSWVPRTATAFSA